MKVGLGVGSNKHIISENTQTETGFRTHKESYQRKQGKSSKQTRNDNKTNKDMYGMNTNKERNQHKHGKVSDQTIWIESHHARHEVLVHTSTTEARRQESK